MNYNKAIFIGRATADPDQKEKVSRFRLAVGRRRTKDGEEKTDFLPCVAFGNTKEYIDKYLTKGRLLQVEGRVEINEVDSNTEEGKKIYFTDIIVDNVTFLDSRQD